MGYRVKVVHVKSEVEHSTYTSMVYIVNCIIGWCENILLSQSNYFKKCIPILHEYPPTHTDWILDQRIWRLDHHLYSQWTCIVLLNNVSFYSSFINAVSWIAYNNMRVMIYDCLCIDFTPVNVQYGWPMRQPCYVYVRS